jgi:hypothetical protein
VAAKLPSTITLAARKARRKALPIALTTALAAGAALAVWAFRPDPPPPPLERPLPPEEPPRPDPAARITPAWTSLVSERKFASARKVVEEAADLPDDARKDLLDRTEKARRAALDERLPELRRHLEEAKSEKELTPAAVDGALRLDPAETTPGTHPVLEWARAGAKDGALAMAAAAAPLVAEDENPWLLATAALGARELAAAARAKAEAAQEAPAAAREGLRKEAEALVGRWRAFAASLPAGVLERHPSLRDHERAIAVPLAEFPRELPELSGLAISACLLDRNPEAKLEATAAALEKLDAPKGIARESRRELCSRLLTARILLALLQGKSEDEAADGLGALAERLRKLEGPANPTEFGPRVEAVLRKLSLIP